MIKVELDKELQEKIVQEAADHAELRVPFSKFTVKARIILAALILVATGGLGLSTYNSFQESNTLTCVQTLYHNSLQIAHDDRVVIDTWINGVGDDIAAGALTLYRIEALDRQYKEQRAKNSQKQAAILNTHC